MQEVVLEFKSVYRTGHDHLFAVENASFQLHSGDLIIVSSHTDNEFTHIIDMALGLEEPASGQILFEGNDWRDMNAFEEAECRSRMGFVFEAPGWISSLTVLENIALRIRHHTSRSEEDIRSEIDQLINLAGISDPHDISARPDLVPKRRRRVYEWVRACLGPPRVILMAFPEHGAASDSIAGLMKITEHTALTKGAAVVIITDDHNRLSPRSQDRWRIVSAADIFLGKLSREQHSTSGGTDNETGL